MVDTSQNVSAAYRYDAYGNLLSSSGSQAGANSYRFSSKEMMLNSSLNSGLYYYLYRFYDPVVQRWINRDPIQENGGVNLYGFCYNSPQDYADPYGEQIPTTFPIGGLGGGLGGTIVLGGGGAAAAGAGAGLLLCYGIYCLDQSIPPGPIAPPAGGSIQNAPPAITICDMGKYGARNAGRTGHRSGKNPEKHSRAQGHGGSAGKPGMAPRPGPQNPPPPEPPPPPNPMEPPLVPRR
jgi:RHS repeat-associated protein